MMRRRGSEPIAETYRPALQLCLALWELGRLAYFYICRIQVGRQVRKTPLSLGSESPRRDGAGGSELDCSEHTVFALGYNVGKVQIKVPAIWQTEISTAQIECCMPGPGC
jgi:hypothetical protein